MTEYFGYLNVRPDKLSEFKERMSYLEVTPEMKSQRIKLKQWHLK